MNRSTASNYLEAARLAIKSGEKTRAQRMLYHVLQIDPQNFTAWLLLAGVTPSPQHAMRYVSRAEILQPDHPAIPRAKAWLEKKQQQACQATPSPLKQPPETAKRPSRHPWSTWLIRGGLLVVMVLLLTGAGWLLRQQVNPESTQDQRQPLIAHALAAAGPVTGEVSTAPAQAANGIAETAVPTITPTPMQLAAKNILHSGQPRATWTVTPTPTATPTATPTVQPTFISSDYNSGTRPFGISNNERWIDVNLTTQSLTAYEGDTVVFSALVSSGTWDHPTVTGQFRIWLRYESQTMNGRLLGYDYYLENVPYVMYFFEDYALHGAYWHNNFGTPMSHGCVNIHPTDAGWLYSWSSLGTLVNVHY